LIFGFSPINLQLKPLRPIYNLKNKNSSGTISYRTSIEDGTDSSGYFYSYTYDYPWVNRPNNVIMHYDLKDQESLTLFDGQLHIKKEDKLHIFELKEVNKIQLEFKYLIIPLIVGGIVLSLSLVGIFSAVVERWAGVVLVTIGIMLLYFGIRGTYQVSVKTFTHTFSFFLEEKDAGLGKFISEFNNFNRKWSIK